jgi:TetR/AcrR family transcriptional repressor of bet genes
MARVTLRQFRRFRRLQTIIIRRLQSNLTAGLRSPVSATRAAEIALGLTAPIDGFWWRYAVDAKSMRPGVARRICHDYLASRPPPPGEKG